MFQGGSPGCLKAPRVGFKDVSAQPCPGLQQPDRAVSQSVCGPTRAAWELVGCEHDTLLPALKPRSSKEVVTSPQKNNPEEPI